MPVHFPMRQVFRKRTNGRATCCWSSIKRLYDTFNLKTVLCQNHDIRGRCRPPHLRFALRDFARRGREWRLSVWRYLAKFDALRLFLIAGVAGCKNYHSRKNPKYLFHTFLLLKKLSGFCYLRTVFVHILFTASINMNDVLSSPCSYILSTYKNCKKSYLKRINFFCNGKTFWKLL